MSGSVTLSGMIGLFFVAGAISSGLTITSIMAGLSDSNTLFYVLEFSIVEYNNILYSDSSEQFYLVDFLECFGYRLVEPGPAIEMHIPSSSVILPWAEAMKAAVSSCLVKINLIFSLSLSLQLMVNLSLPVFRKYILCQTLLAIQQVCQPRLF